MLITKYTDITSVIVDSSQKLQDLLEFVSNKEILSFDLETDGKNPRKNKVYGIGISSGLHGYYLPVWGHKTKTEGEERVNSEEVVQLVLSRLVGKKLLAWNGSFEAQFCEKDLKWKFVESFDTDVMLMLHTSDENLFNYGLKENALSSLGAFSQTSMELMLQSMKANNGSGYEYCKASTESLGHYCVWDCVLTEYFYWKLKPKLEAEGTLGFFYSEVMELYKHVTIPMEQVGVLLDLPKIKKAQAEIRLELQKLEYKIQFEIAPHLGLFTDWLLTKDYPPSRSGAFGQGIAEFYNLDLPRTSGGSFSLALKGLHALPDCLGRSILLQETYIPAQDIPKIQELLWDKQGALYKFNLLSKHHLKKLFFDTLKEQPLSHTDLGNPQVDDDFIQLMAKKYTWAADLSIYNRLTKIKGTYIDRFLDAEENGRFHPQFYQHRTVSGRYGGDLQQLPRPIESGNDHELVVYFTNQIREFFISDPGCVFVDDDYESAEPRTFAHISGEQELKDAYINGEDFYSKIAILLENIVEFSAVKTAPNYLGKLNKKKRQDSKEYALGIPYGLEAYFLAHILGIPQDEAELLVQRYYAKFPNLRKWMISSEQTLFLTGKIKIETGRIRHMPRAKQIYERHGKGIINSLELWKTYHHDPQVYAQMKKIRKELKNYMNNAKNVQVQGRVASMMNLACIAVAKELKVQGLNANIVAQIHDEILVLCPENIKEQVGAIVQRCMESSAPCSVPMVAVPSYGKNFREAKGA